MVMHFWSKHCISIINHTLPSTIRAVISTHTCMSMAGNSTSDSKCYLAIRVQVRVTVAALIIVRGSKCVIDNGIEFVLGYSRSTNYRVRVRL